MSEEHPQEAHLPSPPKKRSVNAKQFLAAFRERPDDVHLMQMFALKPKQLGKIYSTLLQKGVLSEYEYSYRDKKIPELDEEARTVLAASALANMVESPSQALAELTLSSGHQLDPAVTKALEEWRKRKLVRKASQVTEPTMELCPKCRNPKDPSSPDSCAYCGIVFAKIASSEKFRGVSVWHDD
ncbi:MAG: hypothetical protein HY912_24595 [Desulfomonile tiedjei]|uniref:Uncharacterized protein n=1 Tax=Desulfomonile tiedjei TaxID=2358 RepID=A0A9D6Z6N0_9BACT|nr:hypothetical protein [Desulfomonile tiedjei]